jgi:hypothetical protein
MVWALGSDMKSSASIDDYAHWAVTVIYVTLLQRSPRMFVVENLQVEGGMNEPLGSCTRT